ncbi:hypothetical protein IKG12_00280 [Candidatus Saccharibacteria bacterium]|nr:hypothetical protein [Candidatus Saccharibacteria bacterium]
MSRDNLMNGAELRYDGFYNATSLNYVGGAGGRWSATVSSDSQVYRLDVYPDGRIYPNDAGTRQLGRSVRCHTTQGEPITFIATTCLK